jgi:shikimate dehydrogenase
VLTRLGVLGWPVAHSRSPAIHNAALEAVGLGEWRYQLLPVPPELFDETVRALPAAGFRGANVTIPHKEAALRLATSASDRARAIGAANTLTFGEEGAIDADNTDAPALIEALPFSPAGKTGLVLGAGGSARAAVWALLDAGAREVQVWNRTPARAEELCAALGGIPVRTASPAEILVNCTAVGMDGAQGASGLDAADATFKQLPVSADDVSRYECVVDLAYSPHGTVLIRAARERGVATVDGLELLVRQGALSFERFTGRAAPLQVMWAAADC